MKMSMSEKMRHKILIENEEQANFIVEKVMRITLLIFTFI